MDNTISLRQFIDRRDEFDNVRINTFCRLMKKVSSAIDKEESNIIRINLDEIRINTVTGDIVFPNNLLNSATDSFKTVAGFNTGVSLMADRKSSLEHKKISFALMFLGWYCNDDRSAIISDINVLENFDYYMSKVPSWLEDYFVAVFKRMDYDVSFSDYYDKNFTEDVKNNIRNSFKEYHLPDEQLKNIMKVVMRRADNMVFRGESNG
ncbi:MAG: hypothetical protein Q4C29_00410 [bacterium]|nr:hypothetical protein [bacterium]